MALFGGKETKEEKEARQIADLMTEYGLEDLADPRDKEAVKKIASDLAGAGLMKAGVALSFGKAEDQLKIGYLSALVEQNWIMIRQLDKIASLLDK